MITTTEFKNIVREEIRIIRHLGTRLKQDQLEWRPMPEQRSTIELLRYLCMCGIGPARAIVDDSWDRIGERMEAFAGLDLDGFDGAMAAQERELTELFDELTDEDLGTRQITLPWATDAPPVPLGRVLFNTTVRFLVAYRHQLFLYAKQSCNAEMNMYDTWLGKAQALEPQG